MSSPPDDVEAQAAIVDVTADAGAHAATRALRWGRSIASCSLLLSAALCIWIADKGRPQALGLPSAWHGTAADWCDLTADGISCVIAAVIVVSVWCMLGMLGNALGDGLSRSTLVAIVTAGAGFVLCVAFVMLAAYSPVADGSVADGTLSRTLVAVGRPFSLGLAFALNGASAWWLRRIAAGAGTRGVQ